MSISKYIGQPCTSCRNTFKEGDDIVVCPECGSPYHKDCYKLEGKCINTLLHESGSDWHPEPVVVPGSSQTEKVCSNCGTHNAASSSFCTGCGRSLSEDRPAVPPNPTYGQFNGIPAGQTSTYAGGRPEASPFINVRTVSADTDVDSNTVGEYTKYVGVKYYYYIPKFLKFAKTGSKASFNIPAFFFPHLWFFYRKMPVHGMIVMILSVLTGLPSLIEYAVGETAPIIVSRNFMILSLICNLLSWVVTIICAVFGNYMYYKKAKSDIDRLKANTVDPVKLSYLIGAKGGTSFVYVLIAVGVVFALSTVFSIFLLTFSQLM